MHKKTFGRGSLIFLLLTFFHSGYTQQPILKTYNVEDGLPSSHIYETFQDQEGYLWVCTDKGLASFDGYQFDNYSIRDGLPNNEVWGVQEDTKGRLWVNTFDQLVYIQEGKIHQMQFPELDGAKFLVHHSIYQQEYHFIIIEDKNPVLYYLTPKDSLIKVDQRNLNLSFPLQEDQAFFKDNFSADYSMEFLKVRGDSIHYRFNSIADTRLPAKLNSIPILQHLSPLLPSGWLLQKKKETMLVNAKFIFRKNKEGIQIETWEDFLGYKFNPYQIEILNDGKFLFLSTQGCLVLDEDFQVYEPLAFLKDRVVNHILKDHQGNHWISTNNNLYLLTAGAMSSSTFNSKVFFEEEPRVLAFDQQGKLWIGTHQGGLYSLDKGQINLMTKMQRSIRVLECISNGDLLFGGDGGLNFIPSDLQDKQQIPFSSLKENNFHINETDITKDDPNPFRGLKSLIPGGGNDFWFTTFQGLFHFTEAKDLDEIYNTRSYALSIDANEKIWVAHTSGLSTYQDGNIENLENQHPVFSYPINDLKCSAPNALWIATNGLGLYRYTEFGLDTIKEVNKEIISKLYLDKEGNIWAASNKGILHVKVISEKPFQYQYQKITKADGLASSENNDVIVDENYIYTASKLGLSILDRHPNSLGEDSLVIKIKNIRINGEEVPIATSYQLPFYQNNIQIDFVGLSFKSLAQIDYFYNLEGMDSTWHRTEGLELNFPALSPGTYSLQLKAVDINGKSNKAIPAIRFKIRPAWWRTTWFGALSVLLLLLLLGLLMRQRIKAIERKAKAENQINQKFAELELEALQAQMNPHFIFNALHAIQDFIFNKDELVANQYIVKFSRLMRLFLESSKEKYLSLSDELELLNLYVDLEQMRFEGQFDCQFEVAPHLNADLISIPSMLLQPFVENAINHGLLHKKEKGLLKIHISSKSDYLLCQIIDDGVGRKKAQALKTASYKSHKSRGMQLVEERQRVLRVIDQSDILIEIKDLSDKQGQACGTAVDLKIYNYTH